MRKLLVTLFASLLLTACAPEIPVAPGATTTVVTTPACTPRASGGDDTAAVAQIINNCQNTQIVEPLRINGQISVPSGKVITWSGTGQFYRDSPAGNGITLSFLQISSTGVTLNNPQLRGPNPKTVYPQGPPVCGYYTALEHQHGITIQSGHNVTINSGRISNLHGDGIYIIGGSSNITVNNITIDCVGRTSVTNLGSSNVRINGGLFTTTVWWIFNIELQGETVSNYYIDKPTIGYSRLNFLLASCPYGGSYTGVVVNKPVFLEGARQIYTSRCGDVTVNY